MLVNFFYPKRKSENGNFETVQIMLEERENIRELVELELKLER